MEAAAEVMVVMEVVIMDQEEVGDATRIHVIFMPKHNLKQDRVVDMEAVVIMEAVKAVDPRVTVLVEITVDLIKEVPMTTMTHIQDNLILGSLVKEEDMECLLMSLTIARYSSNAFPDHLQDESSSPDMFFDVQDSLDLTRDS